jgi:hypothetical protein
LTQSIAVVVSLAVHFVLLSLSESVVAAPVFVIIVSVLVVVVALVLVALAAVIGRDDYRVVCHRHG